MAASPEIDEKTARHNLDLLEGLYLARIIPQGKTFPLSEFMTAISLTDYLARLP